ncbi:MAG: prolyl oligopeptidase family serine peptidase [Candidatus Tyrphobacter sp.]
MMGAIGVCCLVLLVAAPAYAESLHPFTARTEVEMANFANLQEGYILPPTHVRFSPNGHYFFVVTERGVLPSGKVRSTIRVFRTAAVRRFLDSSSAAGYGTLSRPVVTFTQALQASASTEPAPILFSVQWSADSSRLYFIGERAGEGHVYTVDVQTETLRQLTPDGDDVVQYEVGSSGIAYLLMTPYRAPPVPVERDLTGSELPWLLFPEALHQYTPNQCELGIVRDGKAGLVIDGSTGKPVTVNYYNRDTSDPLSISPDGRRIFFTQAIRWIPSAWEGYRPWGSEYRLIASQDQFALPSWSAAQEFNIIDVRTGTRTTVTHAPTAESLGYPGPSPSVWSADGRYLLIEGTFLPLAGTTGAERTERARDPVIALYDMRTRHLTEVAPLHTIALDERGTGNGTHLYPDSMSWSSPDSISVIYHETNLARPAGSLVIDSYRRTGGRWTDGGERREPVPNASAYGNLAISIRQNLNVPPVLYASDGSAGRTILDPNPQLKSIALGEASIFHWNVPGGKELNGILIKPPDFVPGKRYPLIIQAHGYQQNPHRFVGTGEICTGFACVASGWVGRAMAAHGAIVVQMSEGSPFALTPQDAPREVESFKALIESLDKDDLIDPHRVGFIGWSYGGYYGMYAVAKDPSLFAAISIVDGTNYDIANELNSVDNGFGVQMVEVMGGRLPFGNGVEDWLKNSPFFSFQDITDPIRIEVHDGNSILNAWSEYAGLRLLHKPVDLVQLPEASHVIVQPLEELASIQGNVEWFDFWLSGREDERAANAAEYRRWEQLKRLLPGGAR